MLSTYALVRSVLFVQPTWPFATLTLYLECRRKGVKDPHSSFAHLHAAPVQHQCHCAFPQWAVHHCCQRWRVYYVMYFGRLSRGTLEARFRSGSVVLGLGWAQWFQWGLRSAGVCHSRSLVFIHSYKQYNTLHVILKHALRNLELDCQSSQYPQIRGNVLIQCFQIPLCHGGGCL
jgi:hypothetical protein